MPISYLFRQKSIFFVAEPEIVIYDLIIYLSLDVTTAPMDHKDEGQMTNNTPPVNPPEPNPLAPTVNNFVDWPKELVAALLAIAIVGMTLILLWNMFFSPAGVDPALWQHQSTVIQTCLALAGTVTGYYFGRIPAERAAASANQASTVNALRASDAIATKNNMLGQLKDLKTQLQPGGSPMGGSGRQNPTPDEVRAVVVWRIEQIIGGG
ncbi:hypothetical protein [Nitrosospira sp. Nsp1]|uniref:hypothetical protein n=1 Tax=Nitrosospira sp. Nsp1 TaxID=136547 RepID=UPI00115FA189|nr:hypothetical protein [Nitrosospira sp. Nsp1]